MNVNGLERKTSKLDLIQQEFASKDIIILCETWLTERALHHTASLHCITSQTYLMYFIQQDPLEDVPEETPEAFYVS